MSWRIFEHFALLAMTLLVTVMAVLWRWEKKEQKVLDDEADLELDMAIEANAGLVAEIEQVKKDLNACRDQYSTRAATDPLNAIDGYPAPPSPRERFKRKPQ